jgi:hypothetical protein
LLRVCFCDGCLRAAGAKGIDVDGLRARMVSALAIDADGIEDTGIVDDEAFVAYSSVADESAAALVADVAAALRSVNTGARVAVASPNEAGGPGVPVADIIDDAGAILLVGIGGHGDEVERTAAAVLAHPNGVGLEYMLHPPSTTAMGAVPMNINERLDDPAWLAELATAVKLGVNRISVYNYGLLTDATFRALARLAFQA